MNRDFVTVSADAFNNFQLEAGVLLHTFDPASPTKPEESAYISATTGGITVNCVPSLTDYGEDVDNVPNGMMELQEVDEWDCNFATTLLEVSEETLLLALGCAKKEGNKIVPKAELSASDFRSEIWWVGSRADGALVAAKLMNVLSTSGLSLKTTKNGKGQLQVTLKGHVSMATQNVVPMEFYVIEA